MLYSLIKEILAAKGIVITTEQESLFQREVDSLLEVIKNELDNDFSAYADSTGVIQYPYAVAKFIASVMEYQERPEVKGNLKARSMGTVSYTYKDNEGLFPQSLWSILSLYRLNKRARFHVFK